MITILQHASHSNKDKVSTNSLLSLLNLVHNSRTEISEVSIIAQVQEQQGADAPKGGFAVDWRAI